MKSHRTKTNNYVSKPGHDEDAWERVLDHIAKTLNTQIYKSYVRDCVDSLSTVICDVVVLIER